MQQIRTQPAGPKAFLLYCIVRDAYRQDIGERAFSVYEALTYYVEPKTLQGVIPLKLLAETVRFPLTTVSRCLHRLWQQGLITITPQWDTFECVPKGESVCLTCAPSETRVASARAAPQQHSSRVPPACAGLATRETFRTLKTARRQAGIGGLRRGGRRRWGHSRLRRLHIAPLCYLFNVGGKLWIIR